MHAIVAKASLAVGALCALVSAGCSGQPGRLASAPDTAVVYGSDSSISSAGGGGWTTPPAGGSVQPAPVPVTSTWSAPPAPAPVQPATVVDATPYAAATPSYTPTYVAQPCAPPCAPPAAPSRCWSGCGLPCADGISMWHVRGVIGEAFFEGNDPADNCLYWGIDIGRTFCGCWGLDLFYRYHGDQFDRAGGTLTKDGGSWNHVGVKATYQHSFGQSRFYWWVGLGPEYYWTSDYIQDGDGFGVFGEAGVGYVLNKNIAIRGGVNVHGMDTDVGRLNPADDGSSRWLWVVAPVLELEISF